MAPQIMGPEMNPHHTARFGHHFPSGLITYREDTLLGFNALFPDVVLEPVRKPLGDEDKGRLPKVHTP